MPQDNILKSSIRIPPHDVEAERCVLGSVMIDPKMIDVVSDLVAPEDFYDNKHATIYESMIDLYKRREPIDVLTVATKLKEKKQLEDVGGKTYVTELVNSVPTSSNAKHYAEIVRKKKILRDLIDSSNTISQLGYQEDEDVANLLDEAEKKIFGIARHSIKQRFQKIKDALEEAWDRIDHLHKSKGETRGVASGFSSLDNLLSGFQKSDLIILAARPSMGKTALALDIARNVAKKGIPVGVFSLEMSAQQLVDRMLAAEAMVDSWRLRTGRLTEDFEFQRLRDALDTLSQAPIFIYDDAGVNLIQMRAMARRLQAEHGLGLLVVDYLQLITPRTNSDNIVQQMTEISRSLKALAKELDVPILALSQLSRAVEARQDRRPKLHDLRDSGSIEQDADVVMFIYREDRYKEKSDLDKLGTPSTSKAEVLIEKHRNGPIGRVNFHFHLDKATFREEMKGDFGQIE